MCVGTLRVFVTSNYWVAVSSFHTSIFSLIQNNTTHLLAKSKCWNIMHSHTFHPLSPQRMPRPNTSWTLNSITIFLPSTPSPVLFIQCKSWWIRLRFSHDINHHSGCMLPMFAQAIPSLFLNRWTCTTCSHHRKSETRCESFCQIGILLVLSNNVVLDRYSGYSSNEAADIINAATVVRTKTSISDMQES